MAFDRSKFRAAPMSAIEKQETKAKKASRNFSSGSGGRTTFHKVEEGENWYRIAPAHDPKDSPYVPIRKTMLNCEVDVYEDGEPTGEKEVRLKSIFIGTQHGKGITKDVIETYIDYVYKRANEEFSDKDDRGKFLAPITGFKAKGKWNPGIRPSTNWVTYAWDKTGELGRLELYDNWMKEMRAVSAKESKGETIVLDIFSDPDEGFPLLIEKNKKSDKWKYTIVNETLKRGEDWDGFFKKNRVSDAQLKDLSEMKSLKELLVNVYTARDFDFAIDGLKRFDKKNGFGIFDNEDFLKEVEECEAQIEAPEEREETKTETKEDKPSKKEESKPTSSDVKPIEMKRFIREYILENYGEGVELPNIKGNELKEWYLLAKAGDELPFKEDEATEDEAEEEETTEDEVEETEEEVSEDDITAQLNKLRAKQAKK